MSLSSLTICEHCGSEISHKGKCPRIKCIEYWPNGTLKYVQYFSASEQYSWTAMNQPVYNITPKEHFIPNYSPTTCEQQFPPNSNVR
jgi:hypothetical protein